MASITTTGASVGWRSVDEDPASATRYLEWLSAALAGPKSKVTQLLRLAPGHRVLEAGCGLGRDTEEIARQVAPGGHAVGVDLSRDMIEQAITRTSQLGLPLDFQAGSVFALPFDAASFNAVRIERTLQHLPDPAGAVAELVRVLRPGGRFAVLEPDWQTVVVAGGSREVLRAYLHQKAEVNAAQGAMGRDLPWLLSAAGCTITELIVEPVVFRDLASADFVLRLRGNLAGAVEAGAISHRAADGWWTVLEERDRAGAFLAFGNIVIVGADRR